MSYSGHGIFYGVFRQKPQNGSGGIGDSNQPVGVPGDGHHSFVPEIHQSTPDCGRHPNSTIPQRTEGQQAHVRQASFANSGLIFIYQTSQNNSELWAEETVKKSARQSCGRRGSGTEKN
jgi:hypothetical protein